MKKAMKKERETLSYTQHTKDALSEFADRLGFWPRFVFDRGFGNKAIIEHLYAHRAIFYIRLKAGRYVQYDGQITQVKDLDDADSVIELFGLTLRIIRSDRSKNNTEPWYIITNDMTATRDEIINIYYHRFEIEETFKDSKHIFDLHRARFIKPLSLKIILWFVFLTMAMFYLITQKTITNEHQRHHKKRRSWIKIAYEQYQLAITKHLKIAHNTTYPKVHMAQIGNLTNLTELSLKHNKITTLPDTIGNLLTLTWLWLNGNQLTTLPNTIGNLIKLRKLNIRDNPITHLPPAITAIDGIKLITSDSTISCPST